MKVIMPKILQLLPIYRQTKAIFYPPKINLLQAHPSMLRIGYPLNLRLKYPSKLRFIYPLVRIVSSFGASCKASFSASSNTSYGASYLPPTPHAFLVNKLLPRGELHNFPTHFPLFLFCECQKLKIQIKIAQ